MIYLSHAHLKPGAVPSRVKALKHDLEAHGCVIHVHYGARRMDIKLDDALERWIILGGLANLFANYQDTVKWHPNFCVESHSAHLPERSKKNHAPHHL
jgi:hypothetical protein